MCDYIQVIYKAIPICLTAEMLTFDFLTNKNVAKQQQLLFDRCLFLKLPFLTCVFS